MSEDKEDVGLVLAGVDAAEEAHAAVRAVGEAGVMAGGDIVGVELEGAVHEEVDLDAVVASDAGVEGTAALVLGEEVVDDVGAELALGVDDVVACAEGVADAAGVVDVFDGAAALGEGRGVRALDGPEPEGDADDLVTLAGEEERGDG